MQVTHVAIVLVKPIEQNRLLLRRFLLSSSNTNEHTKFQTTKQEQSQLHGRHCPIIKCIDFGALTHTSSFERVNNPGEHLVQEIDIAYHRPSENTGVN